MHIFNPSTWRHRQSDLFEFKATLSYKLRICLKKKKKSGCEQRCLTFVMGYTGDYSEFSSTKATISFVWVCVQALCPETNGQPLVFVTP